ncbi:MAG: DUF4304 domain-containing protein [Patescibacteria group bacterium]
MGEKFRPAPENNVAPDNKGASADFDRAAEKQRRQEIRKILVDSLSTVLRDAGFIKRGSTWQRQAGDSWQIVYLQRSQFSHQYYLEVGICSNADIPQGGKPDIVFCRPRDRFAEVDFEAPGADRQAEDYYHPSVSVEEAATKIATVAQTVQEYVPAWLDKNSGK